MRLQKFRAGFWRTRERDKFAVLDFPIVLLIADVEPKVLILEYLYKALVAVNSKSKSMSRGQNRPRVAIANVKDDVLLGLSCLRWLNNDSCSSIRVFSKDIFD